MLPLSLGIDALWLSFSLLPSLRVRLAIRRCGLTLFLSLPQLSSRVFAAVIVIHNPNCCGTWLYQGAAGSCVGPLGEDTPTGQAQLENQALCKTFCQNLWSEK